MLLIVNNQSKFIKEYEKNLVKQGIDFTDLSYLDVKNFLKIKSQIKGVILSGGPGIPGNPLKTGKEAVLILIRPLIGSSRGSAVVNWSQIAMSSFPFQKLIVSHCFP